MKSSGHVIWCATSFPGSRVGQRKSFRARQEAGCDDDDGRIRPGRLKQNTADMDIPSMIHPLWIPWIGQGPLRADDLSP